MKNETFYVVAATIIPVYFLGLTLQGAFYEKFQQYVESDIKARDEFVIGQLRRELERGGKFTGHNIMYNMTHDETMNFAINTYRTYVWKIISVLVVIIVVWPGFGEIVAIIALNNNNASLWQDIVVESSVFLLVVATACIILVRLYAPYYMIYFRMMQLVLSIRNNSKRESTTSSALKNTLKENDAETGPPEQNIISAQNNDATTADKQPDSK